jgi:hypothetical protein
MNEKIPMRGGDEFDAFSRWRRLLRWRPGQRKKLKKGYAKRLRKWLRLETKRGDE